MGSVNNRAHFLLEYYYKKNVLKTKLYITKFTEKIQVFYGVSL